MKHLSHQPSTGYADYIHASDRQCPLCNAYLIRTPRRPLDRLWSIFKPVLRYRCQRFACQWHGNLAQRSATHNAADPAAPGNSARGEGTARSPRAARSRDMPKAFIVHMVLAVSGGVLVILVGNSDPTVVREVVWTALGQHNASGDGGTPNQPPASQRMRADATMGVADTTVREAAKQ